MPETVSSRSESGAAAGGPIFCPVDTAICFEKQDRVYCALCGWERDKPQGVTPPEIQALVLFAKGTLADGLLSQEELRRVVAQGKQSNLTPEQILASVEGAAAELDLPRSQRDQIVNDVKIGLGLAPPAPPAMPGAPKAADSDMPVAWPVPPPKEPPQEPPFFASKSSLDFTLAPEDVAVQSFVLSSSDKPMRIEVRCSEPWINPEVKVIELGPYGGTEISIRVTSEGMTAGSTHQGVVYLEAGDWKEEIQVDLRISNERVATEGHQRSLGVAIAVALAMIVGLFIVRQYMGASSRSQPQPPVRQSLAPRWINSDAVNVRMSPTTRSNPLVKVNRGQLVQVKGSTFENVSGRPIQWLLVESDVGSRHYAGWVRSDMTTTEPLPRAAPPQQAPRPVVEPAPSVPPRDPTAPEAPAPPPPSSPDSAEPVAETARSARELFAQNQFAEALRECDEGLKLFPDSAALKSLREQIQEKLDANAGVRTQEWREDFSSFADGNPAPLVGRYLVVAKGSDGRMYVTSRVQGSHRILVTRPLGKWFVLEYDWSAFEYRQKGTVAPWVRVPLQFTDDQGRAFVVECGNWGLLLPGRPLVDFNERAMNHFRLERRGAEISVFNNGAHLATTNAPDYGDFVSFELTVPVNERGEGQYFTDFHVSPLAAE